MKPPQAAPTASEAAEAQIRAAWVLHFPDFGEEASLQSYEQAKVSVKASCGRMPFDDPTDPGAAYEYGNVLMGINPGIERLITKKPFLNHPKGSIVAEHRLRLAEEMLRQANWLAHAPRRGFAALGRPPELQQLVASTCLDLYSRHAVSRDHTHEDSSHLAQLWSRLCPELRINVLAGVAVGLLCDR